MGELITVLGIDPGPEEHSFARLRTDFESVLTVEVVDDISHAGLVDSFSVGGVDPYRVVIEDWVPYGSSLGAESIATIKNLAVLEDRARQQGHHVVLMTRPTVKIELGLAKTAGDTDVRARLLELWGGKAAAKGTRGKNGKPGPLADVGTSHRWAALAVAVAYVCRERDERIRARRLEEQGGPMFRP